MSRSNYTEQVFHYISDEVASRHLSPTQREIAEALFISKSTVQRCISDLEDMGRIETIPGKARSLTIRREPIHFR
ncbi:MAG: winged helix-turn-helix transcriptional regulator [Eubacteriales bacterium]|nr:winged helix-turn-helix transcriptional regulator [Eubacteriales bacterium]